MESVFLKLLNMSITASWLVLGAVVLRMLFKRAPKYLRFIAWALVGIRLLFPISLESVFSLIPSAEPIPQEILTDSTPAVTGAESVPSATPIQTLTHIATIVWICGMALMLGYALVSCIILRRRVGASLLCENGAYICDDIDSPFVFGIIKPRIYIPSSLNVIQTEHVLTHERAHIKRRDHWWKPLAFVLLSVYWFNPVIWVAYILLCRDIELACDERVARNMDDDEKVAYSNSLLELSIPRKMITACPVAFGEVGVKDRIRSVLSCKKPTLWIIIATVAACSVLAVTLMTEPVQEDETKQTEKADGQESGEFPEWDQKYTAVTSKETISPYFCLDEESRSYMFVYSGLSSYISMGTYSLVGDGLVLAEDETENEYVFRKTEEGYTFDASASAALPEYKYSADSEPEACIEDGTLFYLKPAESYPTSGEY